MPDQKRIPTLAEIVGDGQRGDGWEGLEEATRQYLTYNRTGEGATMTLFLRLFCVAAVEGARQSAAPFPDMSEMRTHMGWKSEGSVGDCLNRLVWRGKLRWHQVDGRRAWDVVEDGNAIAGDAA